MAQSTTIAVRKAEERGHANYGWLNSYHAFSFANYYDPAHMGFRHLRVINEDWIAPSRGFGAHPHRDMEIITYLLAGTLEHQDSLGNRSIIRAGEVQRMTAGTGITHSEYNYSSLDPVHLLQIWILPGQKGLAPGYEQRLFSSDEKRDRWCPIVTPDNRDGSLKIHQASELYASVLSAGQLLNYNLDVKRYGWLQVVRGEVKLNQSLSLTAGDGVSFPAGESFAIAGETEAEVLLFDLP